MIFLYSQVEIMVSLMVKMILNKTSENKPYEGLSWFEKNQPSSS